MARKKSAAAADAAPPEAEVVEPAGKKSTKGKRVAVEPVVSAPVAPVERVAPSREATAERARELYKAGNKDTFGNWLRAERELTEMLNPAG